MSTYDDASLIMFPSGYKEDKIYSLKPTDGSGDLTFTRASTATRVNSDGLIEKVRTNELQYSEQANNAYWTLFGATISANTTATLDPSGYYGADKLQEDTSTTGHTYGVSISGGSTTKTLSIFTKAAERNWSALRLYNGSTSFFAYFNLSTGVVGSVTAGATSSITSYGNGWYRCSISLALNAGSCEPNIFASTGDGIINYQGVTGSGIYVWGAQLELGDIATEYIPTTTTAVSVGMLADVPRIDYTGGGCGKLLLESQRTNLVTYSEQFDNAAWYKANNIAVTANQAISPDGTQNADLIYGASSGSVSSVQQNLGAASVATYTNSVFVKYSGKQWFYIFELNGNSGANFFDIQNGVLGTQNFGSGGFITPYGNGWYKVGFTQSLTSGNVYPIYGISNADNVYTNTASGTNGAYIWGASLEIGSYSSSYIPTLASSVTRLADEASKTGISSLIGQTEGVVFLDVGDVQNNGITGGEIWYFEMRKDQDNSFGLASGGSAPQPIRFVTKIAGTVVTETEPEPFANSKIAIKYTSTQFKLFRNGTLLYTTNKSIGDYADIQFMESASVNLLMILKQFLIFPSALSDAECITLTTL